jgi:type I restriction enzyme M protein
LERDHARWRTFDQAFRNIDDVLRRKAGCTTELNYNEQSSWKFFLKYLDDLEDKKRLEAELAGKTFKPISRRLPGGFS